MNGLAALDAGADAGLLNPKLKGDGAAPPTDPTALLAALDAGAVAPPVKEQELPKVLVVAGAGPEELAPKLKTGAAAPPIDPTTPVEEGALLKEPVVTEAGPDELKPAPKTGAVAPPVDPTALIVEEEELAPKLNKLEVVKLLEPPALPFETAVGFTPNKLDADPLLEATTPVSDEEADGLKPKGTT